MSTYKTLPGSSEIVHQALRDAYGIEGTLIHLPGENLNYLVETMEGEKYIAKIAGGDLPPEVVDMEFRALEHAREARLGLHLPNITQNKYGKTETGIAIPENSGNHMRLLEYVAGVNLSNYSDISEDLRFQVGESLSRFDLAMAGFDHPSAHRNHRWDLANAGQHRDKIALVGDPEKRQLLSWAFDQWTNQASPFLKALPWQFIHGDGNPENIRVQNGRVVGLLDLGDSCFNPTVCELAICLAYQMMEQNDPWAAAEPVIAGYESQRPLSQEERAVLFPLICGRLAVTLSVAAERRGIDANNANWFVSEEPGWELLGRLRDFGESHFPRT